MAQSALQKLVCWLNDVISRADLQNALPAASKIAADFGISRSTERAMTRFVASGLLKHMAGKGTFVKWVEPQPVNYHGLPLRQARRINDTCRNARQVMDPQEPRSSADALVAALKDGIASGTFRAGYPLPTRHHHGLEISKHQRVS